MSGRMSSVALQTLEYGRRGGRELRETGPAGGSGRSRSGNGRSGSGRCSGSGSGGGSGRSSGSSGTLGGHVRRWGLWHGGSRRQAIVGAMWLVGGIQQVHGASYGPATAVFGCRNSVIALGGGRGMEREVQVGRMKSVALGSSHASSQGYRYHTGSC